MSFFSRLAVMTIIAGAAFIAALFGFSDFSKNKESSNILAGNSMSASQHLIRMTDAGFLPENLEIKAGETVTFRNEGKRGHWPASNIHPTHKIYPQFDPLKPVNPGDRWNFKFDKAGSWYFHDHLFPDLTGFIVVKPVRNTLVSDSNVTSKSLVKSEKSISIKNITKNARPSSPTLVFSNQVSKNLEAEFANLNIFQVYRKSDELHFWIKNMGAKRVMGKLLSDSGGGATLDCHQESHTIGKAAYEIYGASAFRDGDASCHSGFYHGAMESFLAQKGTLHLAQDIAEICNSFSTGFGKFECLHGVGHGVMAYANYDLPRALQICGELSTDYDKNSCFGGVFMENVVSAQGLGAIPGHNTKWANQDPQFPCNAIDQNFSVQYQCYQMQTSWMLTLYKYDFNPVINECLKVRPDMVSVCFKSTGRDAAGHTLRNPQKIMDICNRVPRSVRNQTPEASSTQTEQISNGAKEKNYYNQCIVGALNVIVDFWGEKLGPKGSELCKLVANTEKDICYSTLASRLLDVFNTSMERRNICNTFEDKYKNYCVTL